MPERLFFTESARYDDTDCDYMCILKSQDSRLLPSEKYPSVSQRIVPKDRYGYAGAYTERLLETADPIGTFPMLAVVAYLNHTHWTLSEEDLVTPDTPFD